MKVDTWKSEMLYQNDNGINISDMSEDEYGSLLVKLLRLVKINYFSQIGLINLRLNYL